MFCTTSHHHHCDNYYHHYQFFRVSATSALDSTSEKVVQQALDNLLKMKKRTTIVIAHRLSTIRNADKIVVLENGIVVEEGTHDSLLAVETSLYATLVKMQITSMGEIDDIPLESHDETPTALQLIQALPDANIGSSTLPSTTPYDVENPQGGLKVPDSNGGSYGKVTIKDDDEMAGDIGTAIIKLEDEVDEKSDSIAWIWVLSRPERPYLYFGLFGAILGNCILILILLRSLRSIVYNNILTVFLTQISDSFY